ncbi:MAG: hypothetical protein ACHP65_04070 [Legionellales bacterium]
MGWWSSVVDTAKVGGSGLGQAAQWAWNTRAITGSITYAKNTFFQTVEQTLALQEAVPALINNKESRQVVKGMALTTLYSVLPLSLYYANNSMQSYFRGEAEQDLSWFSPYSAFLFGLTLVHCAVAANTYRQGLQLNVQTAALDTFGPAAFNAGKTSASLQICIDEKCTLPRKMKGWVREPFILLANDALTGLVSYTPYIGPPMARILNIMFNGRYIARLVKPELCERHKLNSIMHECILSLGLTYEASSMLVDHLLASSVGMPPGLYHRMLRHMLLLLHINLAAHMTLPLMQGKEATLLFDPLNAYEACSRFITDVIISGLMKRIPIDFKSKEKNNPLHYLKRALHHASEVLTNDLKDKPVTAPSFFRQTTPQKLRSIMLPPILQSTEAFINDPIVSEFWRTLQQEALSSVATIKSISNTKTIAALALAPKSAAIALSFIGAPKKATAILLSLSQEQEFKRFVQALEDWLQSKHLNKEIILSEHSSATLFGDNSMITLPPSGLDLTLHIPPEQLLAPRKPSSADAAFSLSPKYLPKRERSMSGNNQERISNNGSSNTKAASKIPLTTAARFFPINIKQSASEQHANTAAINSIEQEQQEDEWQFSG